MKQSRRMSFVESIVNVAVGLGLAVSTQIVVFPWFGIRIDWVVDVSLAGIFTAVSLVRSYVLRRMFEAIRVGLR